MPLHILIVGGGLGGLSAAISCTLAGHRATVLESAKILAEIGAGMQLTPNSTRLLQAWGLGPDLESKGAEPTELSVHRYADGRVLARDARFGERVRELYGAPFIDVHRVDLQKALVRRARELGVRLELGCAVERVDFKRGEVETGDGRRFAGDLVVGADGLWSRTRQEFLGRKDDPQPTGDLAYRVVLSLEQIEDEELKSFVSEPRCRFWVGPNSHVATYSLKSSTMINIVLLVPDDLPPDVARQPGNVEEMRKLFESWDPVLSKFLSYVTKVDKWRLLHRPELESWIHEDGKFVMLGDSCHAMLPYMAQGANSSIEDGAVLGELLRDREAGDLKEVLSMFQMLRKKRGEGIAKETFDQRTAFHLPDGPEQEARDKIFESELGKEVPEVKFPSRWTCPVVQPWLYGYDAYKEVEAARHSLSKVKAPREAAVAHAISVPKSGVDVMAVPVSPEIVQV